VSLYQAVQQHAAAREEKKQMGAANTSPMLKAIKEKLADKVDK